MQQSIKPPTSSVCSQDVRLSVTIITRNEEENIARAIESVKWANEVIVVDSGSTDKTVQIAKDLGATVIHNDWQGYGQQKNFAQNQTKNTWVLNIDADEEISAELKDEIVITLKHLNDSSIAGYYFPRKTFYLGKWIRHGGWYPNYLVRLGRKDSGRWTEPAVHEEWVVNDPQSYRIQGLRSPLLHYTFSNIQDQIITNLRFSKLGYLELKKRGQKFSLAKLIYKPIGKFFETYLLKKGFLDGLAGFIIAVNAAHSMFLKYAYLIETELPDASTHH